MSIKCDSKLLVKPLLFLVIVDTINGFFLNKGMESSIGIIFKAFVLLIAFKILCSLPKFKWLLFFTIIYLPAFLILVILNTDSQIGPTINHLLKFVNVVLIYYAAVVVFKSERIKERGIELIFYINSIVLLLNIYSGLLGIGYYAYGEGVRGLYTLIMKCLACKPSYMVFLTILFIIDILRRKLLFLLSMYFF